MKARWLYLWLRVCVLLRLDCTRTLQAMIDDAAKRGGGDVTLPHGVLRVRALRMP